MRTKRRRISIRDSNSPSATAANATGVEAEAGSTDRPTTVRNPSPQSRRGAWLAASAASSQAYSRSWSITQLAAWTAG